ncbi:hypothetical protein O181_002397 [Austropuccinia psidii MF-1]|uniref:Uncharacterized protein n=1 Tax=Austropuccinia psidii MF-1 TaxID=1389203 RepID=A0A9Q3BCE0_9BASI|nr:hypothetical protein [Austropuccinia psidii MF-1]
MARNSWFNFISGELDRLHKIEPIDVQKLVNSHFISVKQEGKGEYSQSAMKLALKNQVAMRNKEMESFTNSMDKFVIPSSSMPSKKPGLPQIKSLRMPSKKKNQESSFDY